MIKAKLFDGVQSVNSVGKRDELDANKRVISTTVVNVPLCFKATSDEGGEQRTGRVLHNVVIVEKQKEKAVPCSHIKVRGKDLFDLKNNQ